MNLNPNSLIATAKEAASKAPPAAPGERISRGWGGRRAGAGRKPRVTAGTLEIKSEAKAGHVTPGRHVLPAVRDTVVVGGHSPTTSTVTPPPAALPHMESPDCTCGCPWLCHAPAEEIPPAMCVKCGVYESRHSDPWFRFETSWPLKCERFRSPAHAGRCVASGCECEGYEEKLS
jgi:hypothetical protein